MLISVMRPTNIEVVAIRCILPVNYGEEDIPNDYPHRTGDVWDITIDIETGQIQNWPEGIPARDVYMKVVDGGTYQLLAPKGVVVAEIMENYVPACIPGNYGDYVDFRIDAGGVITNWHPDATVIAESFSLRKSD